MTMPKLVLVCALSLAAAGCAAYPRYTAMVEVPNAPVPPHPVAPAGACAGDAEDAAAAADLAATGVQTGSRSCSRSWATTAS